ncbi:MAG: metallophosphoesterase [Lachnospiraceae bacterium]|nr:metallophosphoesterase [Lachnospiraceae bacterium]
MSLYAIGDLHLNFMVERNMDQYGDVWKHHEKKVKKHWEKLITEEDTVVVTGDHTMGRKMVECRDDLEFIASLPGRKILLRGNHDMFWKSKKTPALNQEYKDRLYFLQNNFYSYGEYALVGTKGYCYEGKDSYEHFLTIRKREMERLKLSFDLAKEAGYEKFIMFLHFPPTSVGEMESPFTEIAKEYGVEKVVYSHCHGKLHFEDSFLGEVDGIQYELVSGDYLRFKPQKIL